MEPSSRNENQVQTTFSGASITEEEIEALFATLRKKVKRQQTWTRWLNILVGMAGVLTPLTILAGLSHLLSDDAGGYALVATFLLIICLPPCYSGIRNMPALHTVADLNDKRAIGPLADIWPYLSGYARTEVEDYLIRLLTRLNASDKDLLHSARRKNLRIILLQKRKPLVLRLLKTLEQVGDEEDLPIVRGLSRGNGALGRDPQVRDAALACLPFLENKERGSQDTQTLLRASDRSAAVPAELLRPAAASETTPPQELLRPHTD